MGSRAPPGLHGWLLKKVSLFYTNFHNVTLIFSVAREAAPVIVQTTNTSDARHHRHWQKVLAYVAGLQLSTMHVPLPPFGTVLGGTMELRGNNISLACFHGINFKSKSWALFSLKEPCINFNTESQEIPSTSATGGYRSFRSIRDHNICPFFFRRLSQARRSYSTNPDVQPRLEHL